MATDKTDKTPATSATKGATVTPIGFDAAVEFAKLYFCDQRYDKAGRDLYSGSEFEEATIAQIAPMFTGPMTIGGLAGTDTQVVDWSLKLDLSDPQHFDVCCEMLAGKIEAGEPIPPMFHKFAAARLRGQAKQPARKVGDKGTGSLHATIGVAILMLVALGLTATRNDETRHEESACDAVAAALRAMGLKPLTFKGVKRVWLSRRESALVALQLDRMSRHD